MAIELKYNNTAETALEQIKQKNYTEKLGAFSGEILLVGISFDDEKGIAALLKNSKIAYSRGWNVLPRLYVVLFFQ